MKTERLNYIDALRGFTFISMALYHLMWDLVFIYGVNAVWFRGEAGYLWQQSICRTFILVSGFSWALGKHHLRRGLLVSLAGILVTAVTMFFMPEDEHILFGVLTLIGASMLILIPLEKLLKRVPADIGAWSSFVLFLVTRGINYKFLGFELLKFIRLPQGLYRNPVTAFFGFPPDNFYSADYFSLLPWFFLFVTGYFLKRLFEELGWLKYLKGTKIAPLEWIGRHCLILYMLHQPVIYGLLSLGRRTAG